MCKGQNALVGIVSARFCLPGAVDRNPETYADFLQLRCSKAGLLTSGRHPLNSTSPLFDQSQFVKSPPDHSVPESGNALQDIRNCQAKGQDTGILYFNPVIKYGNPDRCSLLRVVSVDQRVHQGLANGHQRDRPVIHLRTPVMIDSLVMCFWTNATASSAARDKYDRMATESRIRARFVPANRPA